MPQAGHWTHLHIGICDSAMQGLFRDCPTNSLTLDHIDPVQAAQAARLLKGGCRMLLGSVAAPGAGRAPAKTSLTSPPVFRSGIWHCCELC